MSYIGKEPTVGNFQKCDAITESSTATYNLTVGSVAVFPETANNCIVSLNGVIQAPTDAYTIVGSTIVFNSSLTSADVVDFILILGSVLDIGTVSDGTISTAKVADDAITLAKMAAGTDGNVISYDASGNPVAIATGSDGQVLTSTGAGSPPAFEALPVSGGLTYLNSVTASDDATIGITSGISSTYDTYLFTFTDLVPATNTVQMKMEFQVGGSFITSGGTYRWVRQAGVHDSDTQYQRRSDGSNDDMIELSYELSNVANEGMSGHMFMHSPAATKFTKVEFNLSAFTGSNKFRPSHGGGALMNAGAVTGVQWSMTSGNMATGTIRMYGITNS